MSREDNDQPSIAELRAAIQREYDAAQRGLHGFAEVAKHETITAHMERMGELHEQLKEIDESADQFLVEVMDKTTISLQEDFQVGDEVEVAGDYRRFLNGRRGVITEIMGDRARIKFNHVGRSDSADVYLHNLRKVKDDGKE